MTFTVSTISTEVAKEKSYRGIVVCVMSKNKRNFNIKKFLLIVFYIVLSILFIYHMYKLYPVLNSYFSALSAEQKDKLFSDIIEVVLPVFVDIFLAIASFVWSLYSQIRDVKKDLYDNMNNALHNESLKSYGYVSFDEKSFSQTTIDLFPQDCNINKGLVIQTLSSGNQFFPNGYSIDNMIVTAYDSTGKRIKKAKCYRNYQQFTIYFDENSISDKASKIALYKFIVETFNLNRIGSTKPVIKFKLKIFYSYGKKHSKYNYKFSVQPTSGIKLGGKFDIIRYDS